MLWNFARTHVFQHKNAVKTVWASAFFCLFALVLYIVDPFVTTVAQLPSAGQAEPAASSYSPDQPHVNSNSPPSPQPEPFDLDAKLREQENAAFLAKITKLSENASFVAREYREFQNTIQQLAANDNGRKIASDADARADASALITRPLIQSDEIDDLADCATQFQRDIQMALESNSSQVVSAVAHRKLAELRSSADEKLIAVRQGQRALNRLVSLTSHLVPSNLTLAEAIEHDCDKQAQALVESIRKTREAVYQEKIQLAIELEKKQSQVELESMRAQAEADRQMKAAEANAKKIATEKAAAETQLLAEFERDWPQIQHYLGKLFMLGETQPTRAGQFEQRLEAKPVSLAGLKAYCDRDGDGFGRFLCSFNDSSNDRRMSSPFPYYLGGPMSNSQAEAVKPAYRLFVKYQYLLVEKGLLSP